MTDAMTVVRRLYEEAVGGRNLDVVDELFSPDFVSHTRPPDLPAGPEGVKAFFGLFDAGLGELELSVDEIVCQGEWVAIATTTCGVHEGGEILGIKPTGRRLAISSIDMIRVCDGLIVEHRGLTDTVGLLRQLS
jgi:ketosteroid isomerase-like protein